MNPIRNLNVNATEQQYIIISTKQFRKTLIQSIIEEYKDYTVQQTVNNTNKMFEIIGIEAITTYRLNSRNVILIFRKTTFKWKENNN